MSVKKHIRLKWSVGTYNCFMIALLGGCRGSGGNPKCHIWESPPKIGVSFDGLLVQCLNLLGRRCVVLQERVIELAHNKREREERTGFNSHTRESRKSLTIASSSLMISNQTDDIWQRTRWWSQDAIVKKGNRGWDDEFIRSVVFLFVCRMIKAWAPPHWG